VLSGFPALLQNTGFTGRAVDFARDQVRHTGQGSGGYDQIYADVNDFSGSEQVARYPDALSSTPASGCSGIPKNVRTPVQLRGNLSGLLFPRSCPVRLLVMSTACPNVIVLTRFASGALDEQIALGVSRHLENCGSCQQRTDELARETDNLVLALRSGEAGPGEPQVASTRRRSSAADREGAGSARDALHPTTHATDDDETQPDDSADSSSESQLNRLIADAQAIPAQLHEPASPVRKTPPSADLSKFMTALRRSGLLDESRIDQLLASSDTDQIDTFSRQLVDQDVLTAYQARALSRGRWKGLVLGNYEILEKLGQGGMGQVYRAKHRRMGRIVCLKVLRSSGRRSSETVERFRREIKVISSLDHPNFVIAHDADEADGIQFLVMEYVEGQDLSRLVLDGGPLGRQEALELIRQTADALDHAHDQGVIHRDIKPQNLMLTPDEYGESAGHLKVLDLGIARLNSVSGSDDGMTRVTMTTTGAIVGTVDYMSPEQAINSRHADARSDIYSLGCTLYFLLTGKTLHAGETLMERLIAHRERPVPRLSDEMETADRDLEAVFRRMVARDPEKRYQTMAELLADLDAMLSGQRLVIRNRFLPPRIVEMIRRHVWRSAAIAGAVCVLLAGIVMNGSTGSSQTGSTPLTEQTGNAPGLYGTSDSRKPLPLMVVLPSEGFDQRDREEVERWFSKKNLTFRLASSKTGDLQSQSSQDKVNVKIKITDYSPADYAGLVFLGGEVAEYKQQGRNGNAVHDMIEQSLQAGVPVAGVGNGRWVLEYQGYRQQNSTRNRNGMQVTPYARGTFICVPDAGNVCNLASWLLANRSGKNSADGLTQP